MSKNTTLIRIYFFVFICLWSILFTGYYVQQKHTLKKATMTMAENEANTAFLKDTLYRRWVSMHGGVYVPVNSGTEPNPYLAHIKDRDITTTEGKKLTLINPAYMTRLVYDMSSTETVQGHLTSLHLINIINKPDNWELNALKQLETGIPSFSGEDIINNEPYLRFMRPFMTEQSCLKCHAQQGYKVGDIRGGISVKVPLKRYYSVLDGQMNKLSWTVFVIWVTGSGIIIFIYIHLLKAVKKIEETSEKLMSSELNFRNLFETTDDIIRVTDRNGMIVYANRAAVEKLACGMDEMKKSSIFDFYPDDVKEDAVKNFRLLSSGSTHRNTFSLLSRNGSLIPVSTDIWFGRWNGETCCFTLSKDLSPQEKALHMFRAVFENSPAMIAITKMPERIVTDVNSTFTAITGYSKKEILNRSAKHADFFIDSDVHESIYAEIMSKGLIRNADVRFRTKSGEIRHGLLSSEIVESLDTTYILSLITDITDIKEATLKIQQQSNVIQNLLDRIPDFIFFKDTNGIYIGCNPSFAEFAGRTKENIVGCNDYDLFRKSVADAFTQDDRAVMSTLATKQISEWITYPDGRRKLLSTLKTPYKDADGNLLGVLGISRDITELNAATEELRKLNTTLNDTVEREIEKNRSYEQMLFNQKKLADIGKLITAIAHHWRQPLNVLGLYIQDIKETYDEHQLDRAYLENFESHTMEIIQQMSRTIDSFRGYMYQNRENESFEVILQIFNLLKMSEAEYFSLGLSIKFKCSCSMRSVECAKFDSYPECVPGASAVAGNIAQFNQAFLNILDNAKDAVCSAVEKGLVTKGVIEISCRVEENDIILIIKNNGAPIPEEIADKIFNPYFTTKQEGEGTGLGLYLAKTAIEQYMRGSLTFRNSENGVEFIINLARKKD